MAAFRKPQNRFTEDTGKCLRVLIGSNLSFLHRNKFCCDDSRHYDDSAAILNIEFTNAVLVEFHPWLALIYIDSQKQIFSFQIFSLFPITGNKRIKASSFIWD